MVIEALPLAIIMTDADRRIAAANRAALDLFCYEDTNLLGLELEILLPSRFASHHAQYYSEFQKDPVTRPMGRGRDLVALKSTGEEFPVEVGITVLDTTPQLYLASVMDLTLRKQAEAMLRGRQEHLESALHNAKKQLEDQIASSARLEERQRLGRELHDTISQSLYGIGLGLRTALTQTERGSDPKEALRYCLGLIESALVEMRALLFKLRPQSLEEVPLAEVLKRHTQAVSARTKFTVLFDHDDRFNEELDFDQKYAVYRIATEALHNCTKHALDATAVKLYLLSEQAGVTLTVEDNGPGIPAKASSGHGIKTMQERAEAAGGTLEVTVAPGGGALIRAIIPREPPPLPARSEEQSP